MADPTIPNCSVTVHFFESVPSISFTLASSTPGWQVGCDGSIRPPSTGRIIQFDLKHSPKTALFAGFQFAPDPNDFPSGSTPWPTLPAEITFISPQSYPKDQDRVAGPLVFDFSKQTTPLVYRLAVAVGEGTLRWTDPRIYDDGSS